MIALPVKTFNSLQVNVVNLPNIKTRFLAVVMAISEYFYFPVKLMAEF